VPDAEKPKEKKPVLFVLPKGISAEEAARLLRELIAKHAGKPAGAAGGDERARRRSDN
jgi:hypothetical protein